jgi:hypothetical protein
MADDGEWNRKGATLSDTTALKEYGVDREFIIKGINSGALDYRHGEIWGNPYIRVLRSQLEKYISTQLGDRNLQSKKNLTELRKIKKDIAILEKNLSALKLRKSELEQQAT